MKKSEYLKHPKSGRVLPRTAILAKKAGMVPCDADGNPLNDDCVIPAAESIKIPDVMHSVVNGSGLGDREKRKQFENKLNDEIKSVIDEDLRSKSLPSNGVQKESGRERDQGWAPNGVTDYHSFELRKESKQQIRDVLELQNISSDKFEPFLSDLDAAGSSYHSLHEIILRSKPSAVRGNLKAPVKTIRVLHDQLNALDSNSRKLIAESSREGINGLFANLFELDSVLSKALFLARDKYPKNGRLVEYDRRALVQAIASAIQSILGVKPTSTRDGLLEQCVAIVLEDITGKPCDGIHTLLEKVVAESRENTP